MGWTVGHSRYGGALCSTPNIPMSGFRAGYRWRSRRLVENFIRRVFGQRLVHIYR
ncbi:hypothetical protein AB0758_48505 [Tolypothrix bouteillei VB521301_2]